MKTVTIQLEISADQSFIDVYRALRMLGCTIRLRDGIISASPANVKRHGYDCVIGFPYRKRQLNAPRLEGPPEVA